MKKSLLCAGVFSIAVAAPVQATEWLVLPEASTLSATGEYYFDFGGGPQGQKATITFESWTAEISFDPQNLELARIHVAIDLTSARGATENVTDELRGAAWLDAQKNQKAVFESSFISFKGDNAYEAMGKLTLNGVTRDVVLPFEVAIQDGEASAKGEVTILRNDFAIGAGAGANEVALEVTVSFELKATALTN